MREPLKIAISHALARGRVSRFGLEVAAIARYELRVRALLPELRPASGAQRF